MGQFDHSRMEKEATLEANWHSTGAMPRPDLGPGSAADQLPQCFFSLNGKQPLPRYPNMESALSSLVSSPSSHPAPAANGAVIGELTGRLGTICNSGEISPPAHHRSASTSCYSTPLNSPPKLNISAIDYRQRGHIGLPLPMPVSPMPGAYSVAFSAGPWFVEAASRDPRVGGMLSGVSNNESEKAFSGSRIGAPKIGGEVGTLTAAQLEMEIGDGQEESSMSDRITVAASSVRGITDGNARKRKAAAKGKAKETPLSYSATYPSNMNRENIDAKRRKATGTNAAGNDAEVKMESEQMANTNQKQGKGSDAKPPESPKDYIHVRARRGQATDAHSLAERVRREKISKRMKFLQELVPGCNKVTGKAVMLDEIINYVQSLQRQVEFLSMKLATLNPHHNNIENLLSKEMYQANRPMPPPIYTSDIATAGFSCHHQSQATPIVSSDLEPSFSLSALESQTMQLDAFVDANSQLGEFWGADLESVAQIGFGQNQETAFSQSFHGQTHANHMKLEL